MRFSNVSGRETSGMNLKKQPSVLPKKNSDFVGKKSENIMDKKNKTELILDNFSMQSLYTIPF